MLTSWSTPRKEMFRGAPCTMLSWQLGWCDVVVWIMHDSPVVYIGGGIHGVENVRIVDLLELEALAERFKSAELNAAALRMRSGT